MEKYFYFWRIKALS